MDAKIAAQGDFPLKSAKEVADYIRSWIEQDGPIRIDAHLKVDRKFRNVSTRDCKYVLTNVREESIEYPPKWDKKHQNHVLHVHGTDLDGESVEMLCVIDFENFTIVVFNWLA
jgi:hypothetical protein